MLDLAAARAIPLIPRAIVKRLSRRYIAGTSLDEALEATRGLNASGFSVTLDVLGESSTTVAEADEMIAAYRSAIDAIAAKALDAELSIKPTALGLLVDPDRAEARVQQIADDATRTGIGICLDMEDTRCTQIEIDLVGRVRVRHPRLGLAVQAYLKRTYADVETLLSQGCRLRACKGIYIEKDSDLVSGTGNDRAAINQHFLAHVSRCFDEGIFVSIATHDETLLQQIIDMVHLRRINLKAFEFQMLLGVWESIRDRLRDMGFHVRVYIPFGADWYGYSTRRLKENPRIVGYVLQSICGLRLSSSRSTGSLKIPQHVAEKEAQ